MKYRSFFGVLLGLLAISVHAQTLTLVNQTEGLVYFGTSPITEVEYRRFLENPTQLKARVLESTLRMQTIASGALQTQVSGYTNDTLVFGFVLLPGEDQAPLFQFRVATNRLGESYAIRESSFLLDPQGRTIGLSPFEVPVSRSPILVDRRFLDWISIPDGRRFPQTYRPSQVTLRYQTETRTISLDESQFWQKGGTQLDRVKIAATQSALFFMISGYQTLSQGTRFLFRYYPNPEAANIFTIELPLRGTGGPVLLWTPDTHRPQVLGQFASSHFSVEASIDRRLLQDVFGFDLMNDGLWEISSAAADAGIYEEFYYGSLENREFFSIAE